MFIYQKPERLDSARVTMLIEKRACYDATDAECIARHTYHMTTSESNQT